jgi:hypothetical protein
VRSPATGPAPLTSAPSASGSSGAHPPRPLLACPARPHWARHTSTRSTFDARRTTLTPKSSPSAIYTPARGSPRRPLARVFESEIKRKLGDEILFGAIEHGGSVTVDAPGDELSFAFQSTAATTTTDALDSSPVSV